MEPSSEGGSSTVTERDGDARRKASAYLLIVYVHAAKTAGSTIKAIPNLCLPRGRAYVERFIGDQTAFIDLARNSDWTAGQPPRERLAKGLIGLDRSVEYFATVLEPVAQPTPQLSDRFESYNDFSSCNLDEQEIDAEAILIDFARAA